MQKLLEEVKEVASMLWEKGWAESNASNFSIRLDDNTWVPKKAEPISFSIDLQGIAGKTFLVSSSGSQMRKIKQNPVPYLCLVRIDEEGRSALFRPLLQGSGARPTSELPTHLMAHDALIRSQPGQRAVLHAHATEAITASYCEEFCQQERVGPILWALHTEAYLAFPGGVGLVDFVLPGSLELGERTAELLHEHQLVFWRYHGCLATGASLEEAFDKMDVFNKMTKVYLAARSLDGPSFIPDDDVRRIVEHFERFFAPAGA